MCSSLWPQCALSTARHLSLVDPYPLAKDDHSITLLTSDRPVLDVREHLLEKMNGFVPSFPDDLLSDPPGLLAGCNFDLVPLRF
jgi:hypothetical protein